MVLIAGFTYLTVSVDAVNRAVVGWLTEVYQTHTHLSIGLEDSSVDLSKVQVNWVPENITVEKMSTEDALFNLLYQNQSVGSITCRNVSTNVSLNTENAKTTYLSLPNFDQVLLIEQEEAIMLVATKSDVTITIITFIHTGYPFTTGEVLNICKTSITNPIQMNHTTKNLHLTMEQFRSKMEISYFLLHFLEKQGDGQ